MKGEDVMIDRDILDYTQRMDKVCHEVDNVNTEVYDEYGVKRGLRDKNGHSVLTGVTNISKIISSEIIDGK